MVLFVTSIIFLSLTGMIRSGLANSWERVIHYMLMPMYGESMNSAYPSFSVIKMWKNDQIKYHTYFGSYFIDPVLIFVPQFAFKAEGAPKDSYNILGKWEEDHGGRKGISPQGSYHYLAEAIEALSVPGIIIVSVAIAFACIYMESIKFSTLLKQFTYYTFAGTIGVGFVSDQFAWCIRSFGMSFEVLFTFLFLVEVFSLRKKAIGLLIRERA